MTANIYIYFYYDILIKSQSFGVQHGGIQTTRVINADQKVYNQCWSTIRPKTTGRTITFHLKSLGITQRMTCDAGNLGHSLGQAYTCGGAKPANETPSPLVHVIRDR